MKILVTGCLGFIGSHFCRYLLDHDPEVTILGLNRTDNTKNFFRISDFRDNPRFSFVGADLVGDISGVAEDSDIIVHFAAKSFVDHSIRHPEPFVRNNLWGTYNLLEEARRAPKLQKYIQISTDEVYGPILEGGHKEDSFLNPTNPYASTKAAADLLCMSYYHTYQMPVVITRTENNFGPFQHSQKAMPVFVKSVLEGRDIPVYGDGQHKRMWLYVEDHCSAITMLLEKGESGNIYHVAGEQELTNLELASKVVDYVGSRTNSASQVRFVSDSVIRPNHDRRYALNTDKIRGMGWKPQYTLEQGLEKTFQWYIDNYYSWLK